MTTSDTAVKLRARDMLTVEDLFIRDGYVLRFSDGQTAFNDRTFAQFFQEELKINIDDPKWSQEGGSKGKRLRGHIAHSDLDLSLERAATPLKDASRLKVKEALKAIAAVMNAIDFHYLHSETAYELGGPLTGAVPLLYALDRSSKVQQERAKRLRRGEFREEDLDRDDL